MQSFYVTEIVTQDKIIHQGIFFKPFKPGKKAILWIHGLSGSFYGNIRLFEQFTKQCEIMRFGFAAFNNRGHDLISGLKKVDKRKLKGHAHKMGGAGFEVFRESVYDIASGVKFLTLQGFSQIILVGHSTGANKACYYLAMKKDPYVVGTILAGPMSDRLDPTLKPDKLKKDLIFMQKLINDGKGDEPLMGFNFFPITPKRFLSLFSPASVEDQFDYGEVKPKMTYFSKIKKPLLVVLSEKDEYADRSVNQIKQVFDKFATSKNYQSIVIPNALHSYNGMEETFVRIIIEWVEKL